MKLGGGEKVVKREELECYWNRQLGPVRSNQKPHKFNCLTREVAITTFRKLVLWTFCWIKMNWSLDLLVIKDCVWEGNHNILFGRAEMVLIIFVTAAKKIGKHFNFFLSPLFWTFTVLLFTSPSIFSISLFMFKPCWRRKRCFLSKLCVSTTFFLPRVVKQLSTVIKWIKQSLKWIRFLPWTLLAWSQKWWSHNPGCCNGCKYISVAKHPEFWSC